MNGTGAAHDDQAQHVTEIARQPCAIRDTKTSRYANVLYIGCLADQRNRSIAVCFCEQIPEANISEISQAIGPVAVINVHLSDLCGHGDGIILKFNLLTGDELDWPLEMRRSRGGFDLDVNGASHQPNNNVIARQKVDVEYCASSDNLPTAGMNRERPALMGDSKACATTQQSEVSFGYRQNSRAPGYLYRA